jgi:hypothetical protein
MAQETTSATAARAATESSGAPLTGLILLGTFGSSENQRALVRTSQGDTVTLKPGDRIGASPIIAIQEGRLAYNKNGRTQWLIQPIAN